jgi:hypothetical protein
LAEGAQGAVFNLAVALEGATTDEFAGGGGNGENHEKGVQDDHLRRIIHKVCHGGGKRGARSLGVTTEAGFTWEFEFYFWEENASLYCTRCKVGQQQSISRHYSIVYLHVMRCRTIRLKQYSPAPQFYPQ